MVRAEGGSLRFWGPGLLSTSPAFSMSSAHTSGPTFQWAGKVDAICRSRSNRAKRPRAGCILRSADVMSVHTSVMCRHFLNYAADLDYNSCFMLVTIVCHFEEGL